MSMAFSFTTACAQIPTSNQAVTSSISARQLQGYDNYTPNQKRLVNKALELSSKHLRYQFGSANPANGGMDCSGTIYYLLNSLQRTDVPRQSDEIYAWTWRKGKFYSVNGHSIHSFEFSHLRPGDLMFWSGTYRVHRDPPISHVMMYLGKNKQGEMLVFGASDGRSFQHKRMNGVSVFDFVMPSGNTKTRFLGYSCVPGFTC